MVEKVLNILLGMKIMKRCAFIYNEETKYMSFLIKDDGKHNDNDIMMLEKYDTFSDKARYTITTGDDSQPEYNKKYLKTKIKSYEANINTNFHNEKKSKEGFHCICLSVILIDSIFKIGKTYYPQVFYKHIFKEKEVTRHITEDLEISPHDSDESDEE